MELALGSSVEPQKYETYFTKIKRGKNTQAENIYIIY
jgi:hypothetical protein